MTVELRMGAETARLDLSGRVGIAEAAELAGLLRQGLAGAPEVVVESAGLEALDLAGLQTLCAAHRQAQRLGRGLRLAPPGLAVILAARRAGFLGNACMETPCLYVADHAPEDA